MGEHPPGFGRKRDLSLGRSVASFLQYDLPATHSCFLFSFNSEFPGESFKYGSVTDAKSYQGFFFIFLFCGYFPSFFFSRTKRSALTSIKFGTKPLAGAVTSGK